jgi:hypothetical protein
MTGTLLRSCVAAALSVAWTSRGAAAADSEPEHAISVAIGIKAGIIPPVAVAPELVIHFPHLFLGAFGIATPGGVGNGGTRVTVGGEVAFEISQPDQSTAYLSSALFHYEAAKDSAGFYERSDMLTVTGGYEWKARHLDFQLGAGVLFLLKDETPPCSGWFCFNFHQSLLPALDLSLRYRF